MEILFYPEILTLTPLETLKSTSSVQWYFVLTLVSETRTTKINSNHIFFPGEFSSLSSYLCTKTERVIFSSRFQTNNGDFLAGLVKHKRNSRK